MALNEYQADECVVPLRERSDGVNPEIKIINEDLKTKIRYSLNLFVVVSGVLMCAQSALSIYTKSVLTSIEKEFKITSTEAGFIIVSFNIGNMIFVVWVRNVNLELLQFFNKVGMFLYQLKCYRSILVMGNLIS